MSTENAHASCSGNAVVEYTNTKEEFFNVCPSASQDSDTENNDEIDFSAELLGSKAGIAVSTGEDAVLAEIPSMESIDEANHVHVVLKQVLSTSTECSQTEPQGAETPLDFGHLKIDPEDFLLRGTDNDTTRTMSNTKKLILQWEKNNERIKNSSTEEPPDAARKNPATINKSRVRVISAKDRDDILMVNQFATVRRIITREKAAALIQSHLRGFLARKKASKTWDTNATGSTSNRFNRKGSELKAFSDTSKSETLKQHRKKEQHEDSHDSSKPAFSHVEESDLNQHENESNSLKTNEKTSMQVPTMPSEGTISTTSLVHTQNFHSSDQNMKREDQFNCKNLTSEIISDDQSPVCVRITVSKKISSKRKNLNGQERRKDIDNYSKILAKNEEIIKQEDAPGQLDKGETIDEWTRLEQAFFTKTYSLLNNCSGILTSGVLKCGGSLAYLTDNAKCIGPPHQGDALSSDREGLQKLLQEVKCEGALQEKIVSTEDPKRIGQNQGELNISQQQGRQERPEISRKDEMVENHTGENSKASKNSSVVQKFTVCQLANSKKRDLGTEQKARTALSEEELVVEETGSKKVVTTEKMLKSKKKKKIVIKRLFSKKRLASDVQDAPENQENNCNTISTIVVDNEEEKKLDEIIEEREELETSDRCQTPREKPEAMHHSVMEYFSTDLSSSVHCGGLNCVQEYDIISDNHSDQGTPCAKSETVVLSDSNIDESGPTVENELNESVEVYSYLGKIDGGPDDTRGTKTKKNGIRNFFSRKSRHSASKFSPAKQS